MFDFMQRPVHSPVLPNLLAIAVVASALIWVPPTGLIIPLVMILAGMYLRGSQRGRTLGTYLLWGGVALAILAAIMAYGVDGEPGAPVIERISEGTRP